jgi:hypothetical protein
MQKAASASVILGGRQPNAQRKRNATSDTSRATANAVKSGTRGVGRCGKPDVRKEGITSNASTKERMRRLEIALLWCGALVVAGLVVETLGVFIFPDSRSLCELLLTVCSDGAVAVGVFGEVYFAHRVQTFADEIQRESEEKVAQAHVRAAEAIERASKAEFATAEAKRETERLKKEVAWRMLDSVTVNRLAAELSKIASQITLVYIPEDPEATSYCAQFADVFRQAKWQVEIVGGRFEGPPIGIFVTNGSSWNSTIQAKIDSLRGALVRAGIPVEDSAGAVEANVPKFRAATADVKVIIGHKPAPMIK